MRQVCGLVLFREISDQKLFLRKCVYTFLGRAECLFEPRENPNQFSLTWTKRSSVPVCGYSWGYFDLEFISIQDSGKSLCGVVP